MRDLECHITDAGVKRPDGICLQHLPPDTMGLIMSLLQCEDIVSMFLCNKELYRALHVCFCLLRLMGLPFSSLSSSLLGIPVMSSFVGISIESY